MTESTGTNLAPVKLIHVGVGRWGTDWQRNAIPPVGEVEGVAWVDPHESTLETAKRVLDLPAERCFTSLTEAFAAVESEAVLITAPMTAHVPLALEALRAGEHVIVEKPFAGTVAEARQAVDVAAAEGLVLMVSQNYRFYPASRTARRLIEEEALGPIHVVHIDFRKWGNDFPVEGHRHYTFPHPLIYDMAIHHFDLMRMVLGKEATQIFVKTVSPEWSHFVDDPAAVMVVTFEDGTVVSYRGSWVSPGMPTTWAGDWHIECRDGEVYWTGREGGDVETAADIVTVHRRGELRPRPITLDREALHGRSAGLARFAHAIRTGEEPETSGRLNLASVAMMEAALTSAETGQVVDIERP